MRACIYMYMCIYIFVKYYYTYTYIYNFYAQSAVGVAELLGGFLLNRCSALYR